MKLITLLLTLITTIVTAKAQYSTDSILRANNIPTLQTLIDSAMARTPMLGYHVERKAEAESRIKSARRKWLDYVGVESYYRYGRLGVIDVNSPQSSGTTTPLPITSNSTQSQNWWYAGAYIRIPFLAIVDHTNQVKMFKHVAAQSDYEMQDVQQEVALKVIEEYNTMILNLDLLIIKATLLETNNAQIKEAENQYKNGKIDLGRLAQLQEMQAKVATEYATARSESRTALLKLEQMTGIKLRIVPNTITTK